MTRFHPRLLPGLHAGIAVGAWTPMMTRPHLILLGIHVDQPIETELVELPLVVHESAISNGNRCLESGKHLLRRSIEAEHERGDAARQ